MTMNEKDSGGPSTLAIAGLSVPSAGVVKKLEWHHGDFEDVHEGFGILGKYTVYKTIVGDWMASLDNRVVIEGRHAKPEDAKAVCDQHYAARILSALEPPSPTEQRLGAEPTVWIGEWLDEEPLIIRRRELADAWNGDEPLEPLYSASTITSLQSRLEDAEARVKELSAHLRETTQALQGHLPINDPNHLITSADDSAIVRAARTVLETKL